ncbi:MAG: 2Fe-2S iron-sulfur cluster-binding protein [Nitrospinales bacterium]
MARIIFQPDNKTHEVKDGSALIDSCENLDVSLPFGCTEGSCGVCELTVVNGRENCSELTEEEKDYLLPEDIEEGMRLGCQLKIRGGDVTLVWKANRAQ